MNAKKCATGVKAKKQTKRKRRARKPISFTAFRASGRYVKDLSRALPDSFWEAGTPGRVYTGGLYLQRTEGSSAGKWMLVLENFSRCTSRFADLERELYEYGCDEHLRTK